MYMEHNANTVNESQNTIFIVFASNTVNANDIAQIANSGVRFIRLIILLLLWISPESNREGGIFAAL